MRGMEALLPRRNIGPLEVSVVGLGCNNFGGRIDYQASLEVIDAALDAGINFFDTADVYGATESESFIGKALAGRRDRVLIATKFGMAASGLKGGASPKYIREAVLGSLSRLQTDYLDLYQLHRPDPEVPIAETLGALAELVDEGLVKEVGCSNFDASRLEEAHHSASADVNFVSVQNQYSLLHREPEADVLEACSRLGIAFLPYFPLHSGILTGKYRKGQPLPEGTRVSGNDRWQSMLTESTMGIIEALIAFSEERGFEVTDLAFSWLLSRPQVSSVIAGATTPEQVRRNASAAAWLLTSDDLAQVDAILSV